MLNVRLQRLSPYAKLPTKGTKGSAYCDLYVAESCVLDLAETRAVTTGWNIEVPSGYFLDIRPRSGLALLGVTINNSPGVIDTDFRGELKVILTNHSTEAYYIRIGDRIAQCALMPVLECSFEEVEKLSETERGVNGYGSTGR